MTVADLEAFQKAHGLQLRVYFYAGDKLWHAELYRKGILDLTPVQHEAYASRAGWLESIEAVIGNWQRLRGGVS